MPIYQYEAKDAGKACDYCRNGFEELQHHTDPHLETCPKCGAPVRRVLSAPAIGASKTDLDSRAKASGFHKLKKLGKGEYEREY